ncbi:MAG TPA: hypothetical protein VM118_12430 [Acidobacteriota bacterium]|nr:hypothetical protein [Acidobacteriota bacterium]
MSSGKCWIRTFCFVLLGIGVFATAVPRVVIAGPQGVELTSSIIGECDCDSLTNTTKCTYKVFSGRPALSHLIYPLAANCVERYTVSSPFFTFAAPTLYKDRFCGDVFGIKADQELPEGDVTTFTVIYEGGCAHNIGMVDAALKGGAFCELIPVPGVLECDTLPCVEWSIDGSAFDYYVKKPGAYSGRMSTMTVKANMPVTVNFESFGDLIGVGMTWIEAFYATAPADQTVPSMPFLPPAEFNQQVLNIPGDNEYHAFSLWSKIMVRTDATACEYHDEAIIQLVLENQKTWIDLGE